MRPLYMYMYSETQPWDSHSLLVNFHYRKWWEKTPIQTMFTEFTVATSTIMAVSRRTWKHHHLPVIACLYCIHAWIESPLILFRSWGYTRLSYQYTYMSGLWWLLGRPVAKMYYSVLHCFWSSLIIPTKLSNYKPRHIYHRITVIVLSVCVSTCICLLPWNLPTSLVHVLEIRFLQFCSVSFHGKYFIQEFWHHLLVTSAFLASWWAFEGQKRQWWLLFNSKGLYS